jgi:16S rRNA (guanine966-N2)-methyltransferase
LLTETEGLDVCADRQEGIAALLDEGAVEEARVLDLYAGTGALGLEAVSRGAAHATLVEQGRDALLAIRANVEALGLGKQIRVIPKAVERSLSLLQGGAFQLVFCDPPYADVPDGALARALAPLIHSTAIEPDARIVVEHATADASPALPGLRLEDTRHYGDTSVSFYVKSGSEL